MTWENAYGIQLRETGQIYNLIQDDVNYIESLYTHRQKYFWLEIDLHQ